MKILIADDHPLFAEGLKNLLEANDFCVTGIARDGQQAVDEALCKKPDVVLMDIEMPVIDGIEATRKIKDMLPEIEIVMLTSFEKEGSLFKAIRAGASGYLLKTLEGDQLINSLREIATGKNPFSPGLGDRLLAELRRSSNQTSTDDNPLTERQSEVVELLLRGNTYQEIADRLFLSERTIKYHMEQIKDKLGLDTQAQVIAYAREKLDLE